eukprot:6930012-Alexandrium_andersonii.AAC.1
MCDGVKLHVHAAQLHARVRALATPNAFFSAPRDNGRTSKPTSSSTGSGIWGLRRSPIVSRGE